MLAENERLMSYISQIMDIEAEDKQVSINESMDVTLEKRLPFSVQTEKETEQLDLTNKRNNQKDLVSSSIRSPMSQCNAERLSIEFNELPEYTDRKHVNAMQTSPMLPKNIPRNFKNKSSNESRDNFGMGSKNSDVSDSDTIDWNEWKDHSSAFMFQNQENQSVKKELTNGDKSNPDQRISEDQVRQTQVTVRKNHNHPNQQHVDEYDPWNFPFSELSSGSCEKREQDEWVFSQNFDFRNLADKSKLITKTKEEKNHVVKSELEVQIELESEFEEEEEEEEEENEEDEEEDEPSQPEKEKNNIKGKEDEDNCLAYTLKPIVTVNVVESVTTGHEKDMLRCFVPFSKLYIWGKDVTNQSVWKLRATDSQVEFWQDRQTQKIRMTCLESDTKKLRMNHWVPTPKHCELTKKAETCCTWFGMDSTIAMDENIDMSVVDKENKMNNSNNNNDNHTGGLSMLTLFAIKFQSTTHVDDFKNMFIKAQHENEKTTNC